ncbi:MAG: hypothetical protein DMG08_23390 [Acidobacteria bacterium]|nr:MAG: hypothetical protein DMG08_23390 [Acidobacteriota bacterium]PYV37449.1 MAG: hypothetical protein DMG09_14725 [Acidobacteriota bacterium]
MSIGIQILAMAFRSSAGSSGFGSVGSGAMNCNREVSGILPGAGGVFSLFPPPPPPPPSGPVDSNGEKKGELTKTTGSFGAKV